MKKWANLLIDAKDGDGMNYNFSAGDLFDSRFTLIRQIGGGGFGTVFEVYDSLLNYNQALKFCKSSELEDIRRFKREVRIMKSLDHKNVITIIHENVEHDPPYFTMPLASTSVVDVTPRILGNTGTAIDIFTQICEGVSYIHAAGFTHRDIKPANVLILSDGTVVVSDLGLAKMDERDSSILTRATINIMTTDYAPPEMFGYAGTRDLDHRGDIFMLGKTLYNLLSNQNPRLMNPKSVQQGFWYVILKATRHECDDRYQSVGELLDALNDAKRAYDPTMKPKEVFESLLITANENLKSNQYDYDNVQKIIQSLFPVDEPELFLDLFDKIPVKILSLFAGDLATEAEPLLEKYYINIKKRVGDRPYSYADEVTFNMTSVFNYAKSPQIKSYALMSILNAAVRLNRFASMDKFDNLLLSLTSEDDAFAVAATLRDEVSLYRRLYKRLVKSQLHPAIQLVWEQCKREDERENEI
ncbi:putative serine/threonine protein kinase [Paenibacillus agaridevorans]|uniref:non-specific serine/threonine protein kinase n=1 Tax=Paenibacillus agaridevorans TaxID=171404 RepID=A0A2R5EYW7_9BACL|nr:serine/threonine-protein kinase [Paenibacillus agaridevorans]GBG10268.1 putative serine/threonine protein kinase [Paenibacillus agaridevorans]